MQTSVKFWDKAAAKYAKSPIADMASYEYTLERTRSYLSPDDRILEVGCGTGSTALLLADAVNDITASDVSGAMIDIGQQKARKQGVDNVQFVKGDLLDGSLPDGPYDAVLALNLIHLLEDIPAAIKRINGLLKPGGTFISKTVCDPSSSSSLKFRLLLLALPLMQMVGKAPYVNFLKIDELEGLITAGGFKIVEAGNYPAAPPSRYIVAKKVGETA